MSASRTSHFNIFSIIEAKKMNGTQLLIDTAVFSAKREAREIAVSELCNKNSTLALEYVAKNSEYPDTRMSVTRYLYLVEATPSLKRLSKMGRFKDVKHYAKKLLETDEFDKDIEMTYIETEDEKRY